MGKLLSQIGEKSGVVVNDRTGKTASAHDLRRSFGSRWSSRVMPAELMKLMRHTSISTTMTFYVTANADEMSQRLRAAMNTSSSTSSVTIPTISDSSAEEDDSI